MPWSIVDPLLVRGTAGPSACACTAGNSAPIKQTNKTANCIIVLVISTSFPQTRVHCFAQEGASVTIPTSLLPFCDASLPQETKSTPLISGDLQWKPATLMEADHISKKKFRIKKEGGVKN